MSKKATVNPVQKFKELLPSGSRTYGTIQSVNPTDDTSVVQLQSGSQIIARGSDYTVSDRVLVVDGEIRQKVPTLPFTGVTIF
jgi:hypothetical protein